MKLKAFSGLILTLVILGTSFVTFNLSVSGAENPKGVAMNSDRFLHAVFMETGEIIISQSEYTWYGDFIVNAIDKVRIENCNFKVENGQIYVYGTLEVINSTIWMRNAYTKTKRVFVHGNFTMLNSQILRQNQIWCYSNSHVSILNSSSPTTSCLLRGLLPDESSSAYVCNSILKGVYQFGGNVGLNTTVVYIYLFGPIYGNAFCFASNSNISAMWLEAPQIDNLEIRHGLIENLTIYSENQFGNFTLVDSYVTRWEIYCDYFFPEKISNSIIDLLSFPTDNWSGNLTLTSGHIEYLEMEYTPNHMIIENTTVNEWEVSLYGTASIQIENSDKIGIYAYLEASVELSIINSNVTYLYKDLHGTLLAMNSSIRSIIMHLDDITLNLTLKEGFYDFFDLCLPEQGCNMTLVDSTVSHWGIETWPGMADVNLNLSGSTLTKDPEGWHPYSLLIRQNAACSVYNSNLDIVYCSTPPYGDRWATLTLTNCTVNILYAYGNSNITAINSTINMLITDPVQITLINSNILLELDFSFDITAEDEISIASSFSEECNPPLPESVRRFSQYVNITTTYDDYFEAQVRIHYTETAAENRLLMYYLDESNIWQLCPIQGVNTIENYVWANMTHFSCFVLAYPKFGDLGGSKDNVPTFLAFDGEIDGFDFALFIACYKKLAPPEAMRLADLGGPVNYVPTFYAFDEEIDGYDFALFIQCYKGLGPI